MPPGHGDAERAQALLEQGASLYEEGKLYEAISCWRQVLAIDPHNEIAAEYLRFIEDNFQIGIDAFLEHHSADVAPDHQALLESPDELIEQAIDESIDGVIDESIEELDWSELLDDGPETTSVPPPIPHEVGADEAFFADLEPGSLEADPGEEAQAWGAADSSGDDPSPLEQSMEAMPDGDPFTLPRSRFAVEYGPGDSAPDRERSPADSSIDSLELNLGDLGSDRGAGLGGPHSSSEHVLTGPKERHRPPTAPAPRKDLADMSEESIDQVLEEDFKAWEGLTSETPADVPFESARPKPIQVSEVPDPFAALADDDLELDGEVFDSLTEPSKPSGAVEPPAPDARPAPTDAQRADQPDTGSPPAPRAPARAVDAGAATTPRVSTEPSAPSGRPPLDRSARASAIPTSRDARSTPPIASPAPPPDAAHPEPALGPGWTASPSPAPRRGAPASAAHAVTPAYGSAAFAAPASPAEPDPAPPPAAPPTDLDDDLRAILSAGIAAIDAAEARPKPNTPRRLVEPPPPGTDLTQLMKQARRRQQADDFSGAIALVEQVLAAEPDHGEARRYLEQNTDRLLAMYRSRLGSLGRVPRVRLRQQEIVWQSLDHREGFILSQVDGRTSFEEIIDISGMTELQASRILARLVEHGVIG